MSAIQRKFDEARKGQKAAMAMGNHTLVPWSVCGENIQGPQHEQICEVYFGERFDDKTGEWVEGSRNGKANARHICLCVNTHERLVEALKTLLAIVQIQNGNLHEDTNKAMGLARTLLSEIEKGGAE